MPVISAALWQRGLNPGNRESALRFLFRPGSDADGD
jgi:hypothetical protein